MPVSDLPDYVPLPAGIRSRFVEGVNGLRMHVLEAGHEHVQAPCVLLLHGFPELSYSWRKIIGPLAAAGYHVVAPDQRGYGRTTGWDGRYDGDLASFRLLNLVKDTVSLMYALGYRSVACVVGHDFGSSVAAWCALVRPDIFRSVVLMSAPFAGAPTLPFDTHDSPPVLAPKPPSIDETLSRHQPPHKHYQWYYSTREADSDMMECNQGIHRLLRAYFHHKSADWQGNQPFPLASWSAGELARMPTYYIMDREKDMAETVAAEMPSAAEIARCSWLPDDELAVYSATFAHTGFQGGLQWYRNRTEGYNDAELSLFADRSIDIPAMYIAGVHDWGTYQAPGAFERMQSISCTRMVGCHLIENAGHWVQQEQPEQVCRLLLRFVGSAIDVAAD